MIFLIVCLAFKTTLVFSHHLYSCNALLWICDKLFSHSLTYFNLRNTIIYMWMVHIFNNDVYFKMVIKMVYVRFIYFIIILLILKIQAYIFCNDLLEIKKKKNVIYQFSIRQSYKILNNVTLKNKWENYFINIISFPTLFWTHLKFTLPIYNEMLDNLKRVLTFGGNAEDLAAS